MSDTNPYAAPGVAEPEVQSTRYWYVEGIDLLAKSGATLPKVDLDTGVRDGPMKSLPRVVKVTDPASLFKGLALFGGFLWLWDYLELEQFGRLVPFLMIIFIAKRLGLLRENPKSVVRVWTFVEEARATRTNLRRRIRIGVLILIFISLMAPPFFADIGPDFLGVWFAWVLPGGILCMIALAIWSVFDRPKTRTKSESPGWLRFSRVHPQAIAFLRAEEEQHKQWHAESIESRKRLVRTAYFHRYPLRMLIGNRIYNPFAIIQITMMKLLRSKLLVRMAYHFSEAEELPLEKLVSPLRESAGSWLASHPGWTYINGDRLTAPAGDLTVENAVLASPDLLHCAVLSRAWLEQLPDKGVTQFRFITWLADGNHVSTHDHPYLALSNPHLHHRASGKPEQIFQAHLGNLTKHAVEASTDIAHLQARLLHEKKETDRLLTERGLQSEVREAG